MKMNPPASSNSPTSRKKPRIMRHLISVYPSRYLSRPGAVSVRLRQQRKTARAFVSRRFPGQRAAAHPAIQARGWKTLPTAASHYRVHGGNSTSSVTYRHFTADLPELEDAGKR